ncbi:hypothetical protein EDF56_107104 [Novosphingobium sp. PhB165]|uniref:tetratricopeptide repeat-containing protein n=1 Tax=Novosphingobium sp. PhB165 TaxID=2485105 RepID=UPI0010E30ADD|nr:tetratricopeptide repeat-containing protein [Novosphingobium sp. PhB165]TCM16525.1 hypothetical protein EDF56_107104 [Novosphingobium sp. PhB165]
MIHSAIARALPTTLGPARLGRMFENKQDLSELVDTMIGRISSETIDAGAMLDLSFLIQFIGNREEGLSLQAQAIAQQRIFENVYGDGSDIRVLALLAPGDLTANTPLDFLLEHSNVTLITAYLDLEADNPLDLPFPEHDIAIIAAGEAPESQALLRRIDGLTAQWPRPILNGRAINIANLTRDGVANALADVPEILAPATRSRTRADIALDPPRFPSTIRPAGTQAGIGLEKVENPEQLADYLARHPEGQFYVADFIDYSGPDGLFCKQRIVFIDRVPYISHLAVSDHWIVHYMSAGMAENAGRRDEEAAFMAAFDQDFAARHARAFDSLCDRIGLDYFGIDCGETPDGRLLLFEADVAMIVHSMEDAPEFAYKKVPMTRLFDAFIAFLRKMSHGQ